jgi:S-DNA-T family DNA segregation ATPase FtsK/SpoIIIE
VLSESTNYYNPNKFDASNIAVRVDEMFKYIARFVVSSNLASTFNIQRRFGIGYNKAGKIMDQLEAAGIVGPTSGGKPRAVLVDSTQLEQILSKY